MHVRVVFIVMFLSIFLHANERITELEEKLLELTKRLDSFENKEIKEEPKKQFDLQDKTIYSIGGRIDFQTSIGSQKGELYAHKKLLLEDEAGANTNKLNMTARASRLWFKTRTPTEYGPLRTLIELDFKGTISEGSERTTNGHGARLRHAYAQIGMLTIGQTNSTFNAFAVVDTVSYIINDTLVRQPLVRISYESGGFGYDLSFEKPESTLIYKSGIIYTPKDDIAPDIIARARYYPSWGEAAFTIMGRCIVQNNMEINDTKLPNSDRAYGYGVNISTKIKSFGNDDIVINAQYGLGLGRYIAYSAYPAGFVTENGEIKLQESFGWHVGYRHMWSKDWRSTLAWGYVESKNDKNIEEVNKKLANKKLANKKASSIQANLFYNLIQNGFVGIEYIKGLREVESGNKGKLDMALLIFRYDF